MTNCGGRYASGCRRLACPLSMVCGSPTQELAGPASCRRPIESIQVECQVDGVGIVLIAHEACYTLWQEESVSSHSESPEGQPQEGGSSPSGDCRAR
jgi:hypothetical protein